MGDKGGCQQPWTLCRSPTPTPARTLRASPRALQGTFLPEGPPPTPCSLCLAGQGKPHAAPRLHNETPNPHKSARPGRTPGPTRLFHHALLLGPGRRAREPPPPRRGPRLGPHPPSAQGLLPPPSPTRVRGRRARAEPPAATSPARIPQGRAPGRSRLGQDRPPLKGLGSLSHARPTGRHQRSSCGGRGAALVTAAGSGPRHGPPPRPSPANLDVLELPSLWLCPTHGGGLVLPSGFCGAGDPREETHFPFVGGQHRSNPLSLALPFSLVQVGTVGQARRPSPSSGPDLASL